MDRIFDGISLMSDERSVADEVADVRMRRPHVLVLGAGASRAACPNGDKNGKILPLMTDFAICTGIEPVLKRWGIDPTMNFEDTYSNLSEAGEHSKLAQLNQLVENYFGELKLPDYPTIYDHIVLSLREHDIIATFNWDPLLLQAYLRNSGRQKLPKLAFLHGNLLVGYCETDRVLGLAGNCCRHCGRPLIRTQLLYPVRHKNYASDPAIASQWALLKYGFKNAFMITIFGYSGPKTDQEAIGAMQAAWGTPDNRNMEQTAFITLQTDDEISQGWDSFIHTHHYEVQSNFYDSWLANHPRRTGEAYISQYIDAQFISNNPIPKSADFPALWAWFEQFRAAEDLANPARDPATKPSRGTRHV
jgi:hypothetical protein